MFAPSLTTFKTDCPHCGGHKKLKTKVSVFPDGSVHMSGAKCHKCGFTMLGGLIENRGIRVHWVLPGLAAA